MKGKMLLMGTFLLLQFSGINQIYSQNFESVEYLNSVGDKKTATIEDATALFLLTINKKPGDFKSNIDTLVGMKLLNKDDYKKDDPARRGTVALMVARYLKLGDSLFYNIFGSERYAFRAVAAEGIMRFNMSEWDKLSGEELLELIRLVGERSGEE